MKGAAIWAFGDGPATGELAEAAFLLRMGWTWQDYMEAPDSLVEDMMALLNAEAEAQKSRQQEQK